MAKIRSSNLRREEVDTVDEVQRTFNDVYRILREQQKEIEAASGRTVRANVPVTNTERETAPQVPAPATPVVSAPPKKNRKESNK